MKGTRSYCKSLCETIGKNRSSIVTYPNFKFCATCHKWFECKLIRCPCCNIVLRSRPNSNKNLKTELKRIT
jgi:hypothetical protein